MISPPHLRENPIAHPPSDNPTLINFFTRIEQDLISTNTPRTKTYCNLTSKEKSALNNLKNNQSIVIKPCDKGGDICIMNTRDYLTKIHTHLRDLNTYKPLTYNATNAIVNDTCTLIEYMLSQHIIDKATKEFLLPPRNARTPLFYGLPKIHKPGCPLRPIVSGCDGPHQRHKTFSQLHWGTSTSSTQCPLSHCWFHIPIHKHSTRSRHRSRASLHGGIQASTSHKLSTTPYNAHYTWFHPQIQHCQIHGHAYTTNPWHLHGN